MTVAPDSFRLSLTIDGNFYHCFAGVVYTSVSAVIAAAGNLNTESDRYLSVDVACRQGLRDGASGNGGSGGGGF